MFSKLAYAWNGYSFYFKISLCYHKKWEKKLCISVNIYCRLMKLGMGTHFFKISLCYDKKWEI